MDHQEVTNNVRLKIMILGSCVSRDILNYTKSHDNIKLVDYFARSSLASLGSAAFRHEVDLSRISTNFGKKMVMRDLNKDIFLDIGSRSFDILLLDLIDERFKVFYDTNKRCCTLSSDFVRCKFDLKKIGGRVAPLGTNLRWNLWEKGLMRLIKLLRQKNSLHKLYINKVYWSVTSDNMDAFTEKYSIAFVDESNKYLDQMYDRIAQEIPATQFIVYPHHVFKSSSLNRWGLSPYHYTDEFYLLSLNKIKLLRSHASSTGQQPVFDFSTRLTDYLNRFKYVLTHIQVLSVNGESFLKGIYKVSGFPSYLFKLPMDWGANPFENRTWQWSFQQLSFIPGLIACQINSISSGFDSLTCAVNMVISWADECIDSTNLMVWHDHATALRLRNILLLLVFLRDLVNRDSFYNPDLFAIYFGGLLQVARIHVNKLLEEEFYSKGTNHGLDQSLVLYQAASELPELQESENACTVAAQRINYELSKAFKSDGGHVENSPAYLNFGLKQAIQALFLVSLYQKSTQHIDLPKDLIDNAVIGLTHMTRPDGKLPLIGDTVDFKVRDFLRGEDIPEHIYKEFLYSVSGGKSGCQPRSLNYIQNETGYAVLRSSWEKSSFLQSIHIVFKAGFHSRYHRHDDDLSFVLYAFGEDWIIDSGLYKHDATDKHRVFFRSAEAHNITMPAKRRASRDISNVSAAITRVQDCEKVFTVTAMSNMFLEFHSTRTLSFDREHNVLQIIDECIPKNSLDGKHDINYITRFILPAGKIIQREEFGVSIIGKDYKMQIIAQQDIVGISIKSGKDKNNVAGWRSSKANVLEKAIVVEFKYSAIALRVEHQLKFTKLV